MKRATLVALLFGFVLSFTTGITPAGASVPTRAVEDFETPAPYFVAKMLTSYDDQTQAFTQADNYDACTGTDRLPLIGVPSSSYTWTNTAGAVAYSQHNNCTGPNGQTPALNWRMTVWPADTTLTLKFFSSNKDGKTSVGTFCKAMVGQAPAFDPLTSFNGTDPNGVEAFNQTSNESFVERTYTLTGLAPGKAVTIKFLHQGSAVSSWGTCGLQSAGPVYDPNNLTPTPSPAVPQLACGRTMRDGGNGQWFAEVFAMVRNPPVPGSGYSDHSVSWRPSWDAGEFYGKTATIALPPGAAPGDNNRVQFTMYREWDEPVGWSMPSSQSDALSGTVDQDGDAEWLSPVEALDRFLTGVNSLLFGGGSLSAEDEAGGQLPMVPTVASTVKRVYARCWVNVDPDPEREGQVVTVVVNVPDSPDDPNPPTDGGSPAPLPGNDGGCGGGSWWNPVTWARSLFCKLGDIWDVLTDLLGKIWDFVSGGFDLVFPDINPSEWMSKFPLSLIPEVKDGYTAVRDALQQGVGAGSEVDLSGNQWTGPSGGGDFGTASTDTGGDFTIMTNEGGVGGAGGGKCGPMIDPDLDQKITLPGDGTAAKLDALKVSLPVPVDCPGQSPEATELADLHGMRRPVRAFLLVTMVVSFIVKVAHSFGPGKSELAPDMIGGERGGGGF